LNFSTDIWPFISVYIVSSPAGKYMQLMNKSSGKFYTLNAFAYKIIGSL